MLKHKIKQTQKLKALKTFYYSKKILLISSLFAMIFAESQTLVHHTTNWFGPNANPVPEFTEAKIPDKTTLSFIGDYYFGYGDQTQSLLLKAEIPLIPEKVSIKFWGVPFEKYNVTDEVKTRRNMLLGNSGTASGDFYVQTRIAILSEKKYSPSIIFNATLKTASGKQFKDRRFFDTAGYYFDTEIGKSVFLENQTLKEIRFVGNLGFFSWDVQTPGLNVQDDAIMYGAKLILKNKKIGWENTFAGYFGWLRRTPDYGNKPVIFASRFNYFAKKNTYFLQYQHGIKHFPFNQIRIGAEIPLSSLTPDFFKSNKSQ